MAMEEARPFTGEVEIDESYFGPRRVRGWCGRGAGGKTPVIGLLKRSGKVFIGVVKNCSRAGADHQGTGAFPNHRLYRRLARL